MKKYIQIGKINFLNNIQYFSEFFFKAIFILVILFIFTNIWKTIYSGKAVIEGFTIAMMIWYLLMTESIVTSTSPVVKDVNKEIQSGDVAYQLNKPYNYIFYHLAKSFSHRTIGFFVTFSIGAVLIYFMIGGIPFNLMTLPMLLITIILALVLDFFMIMSIALLAFWFEDTNSFKWIYDKILFTIGGMLVPLEIFPKWLSSISNVLPFGFVAYHPAKLFVNFEISSFLKIVGIQLGYILVFLSIVLLIYKIGSRRLNINGG
jgi:ABC-2 type transport system permease protein